jgi:hypothetical protein
VERKKVRESFLFLDKDEDDDEEGGGRGFGGQQVGCQQQ